MEEHMIVKPPESVRLKSRKIILMPGEEVGEHKTENREEVIVVMKGNASIICSGKKTTVSEGNAHFIGSGLNHNVMNESESHVLEYVYVVGML